MACHSPRVIYWRSSKYGMSLSPTQCCDCCVILRLSYTYPVQDNDKNWWDCKNLTTDQTGKIPSPSFEQRRREMSQPPPDKQKSSCMYNSSQPYNSALGVVLSLPMKSFSRIQSSAAWVRRTRRSTLLTNHLSQVSVSVVSLRDAIVSHSLVD